MPSCVRQVHSRETARVSQDLDHLFRSFLPEPVDQQLFERFEIRNRRAADLAASQVSRDGEGAPDGALLEYPGQFAGVGRDHEACAAQGRRPVRGLAPIERVVCMLELVGADLIVVLFCRSAVCLRGGSTSRILPMSIVKERVPSIPPLTQVSILKTLSPRCHRVFSSAFLYRRSHDPVPQP